VQYLFREKAITSASILSPAPHAVEAFRFAAAHKVCAGIHLTLSNDFSPLSAMRPEPSVILSRNSAFPEQSEISRASASAEVLCRELQAQVELADALGAPVTHLDSHQGCVLGLDNGSDVLLDFVWGLCISRGIPFKLPRRIIHVHEFQQSFRDRMALHLRKAEDKGIPLIDDLIVPEYGLLPGQTYSSFKDEVLSALKLLEPGTVTELTLHPALPNEALKREASHWLKREWEFRLCLDKDLQACIHSENIRLIPWKRLSLN
jgi:chitin disaccharide deacetylase